MSNPHSGLSHSVPTVLSSSLSHSVPSVLSSSLSHSAHSIPCVPATTLRRSGLSSSAPTVPVIEIPAEDSNLKRRRITTYTTTTTFADDRTYDNGPTGYRQQPSRSYAIVRATPALPVAQQRRTTGDNAAMYNASNTSESGGYYPAPAQQTTAAPSPRYHQVNTGAKPVTHASSRYVVPAGYGNAQPSGGPGAGGAGPVATQANSLLKPVARRPGGQVMGAVSANTDPYKARVGGLAGPCLPSYKHSQQAVMAESVIRRSQKQELLCPYPNCQAKFRSEFSLRRHEKRHTGVRPFMCNWVDQKGEACGMRFSEKSTLNRHIRSHTGEKPYCCNFAGCKKLFADRMNWIRHTKKHYSDASA
eukprot:g51662.t1